MSTSNTPYSVDSSARFSSSESLPLHTRGHQGCEGLHVQEAWGGGGVWGYPQGPSPDPGPREGLEEPHPAEQPELGQRPLSPGAQPGRARCRDPCAAPLQTQQARPGPIYPCRPWCPPDRGARGARSRPCCLLASRERAGSESQRLTARGAAPHATSGALGAGPGSTRLARHSEAPEVEVRGIRDAHLTSGGSALRDPRPPWSRTVRAAPVGTRTGAGGPSPPGTGQMAACLGPGGAWLVCRASANVFVPEMRLAPRLRARHSVMCALSNSGEPARQAPVEVTVQG